MSGLESNPTYHHQLNRHRHLNKLHRQLKKSKQHHKTSIRSKHSTSPSHRHSHSNPRQITPKPPVKINKNLNNILVNKSNLQRTQVDEEQGQDRHHHHSTKLNQNSPSNLNTTATAITTNPNSNSSAPTPSNPQTVQSLSSTSSTPQQTNPYFLSSNNNLNQTNISTSTTPSSSQSIIPESSTQNSTTHSHNSLPNSAWSANNNSNSSKLSSGHIALLVAGVALGIFALALCCVKLIKRRQNQSAKTLPQINKINIKGPFTKSNSNSQDDDDDDEIFGGSGHITPPFKTLTIDSEKRSSFTFNDHIHDFSNQPKIISSLPFQSPTNSTLNLPQVDSNHLDHSILPSSQPDPNPISTNIDNNIFLVERTYEAKLADELILYLGDRVQVTLTYEDGWCLGRNLDSALHSGDASSTGVFPRDCLSAQPLDKDQAPILPPLNLRDNYSSGATTNIFGNSPGDSGLNSFDPSFIQQFPSPPPPRREAEKRRISSLAVTRDTQLFLELNQALGDAPSSPF
ncbi:hypothetical protein O181_064626 [Austropuccinia psidii MF-1]|uniref:SH3 domain-containing protein n=1 Tax=Austropuccinia psidii MF-1 TaxID=1389203 RepID=A0A9Q3EMC9_9BASI|nr:hypothetical protein [Austropuccinia psidii MF-1]